MMTRHVLLTLFLGLFFLTACTNVSPTAEPTQVVVVEDEEVGRETAVTPSPAPTNSPTSTLAPSATPTHTPIPASMPTVMPTATISLWSTMPIETELAFEVVNQIGGRITAVQVSDDYAYVGIGPRLVVLDVSNASQPEIIGQSDILPGVVQDIAITGNHVFVSTGENGFWIIDVSNPYAPQIVSFEPQPSTVAHLEYQDAHLFTVGKKTSDRLENELVIYSVTDTEKPVELSRLSLPHQFYGDLILDGERIYLIDIYSPELYLVDVSQLEQPMLIDTISVADRAVKTLSNKTLYSLENGNLQILDVTDSQQPIEIAQIENLIDDYWEIDKVMVREDHLFVSAWYCDQRPCGATLMVFDIANPTQTEEIARIHLEDAVVDVQAANGMMYVLLGSQFLIANIPDESSWHELGRFQGYGSYGKFSRLAEADNRLYVIDLMGRGVVIFSLEQPEKPIRAGRYVGAFDDIAAGNNQMYPSARWQNGLHQVLGLPSRISVFGEDASIDGPPVLENTRLYALFNGYLGVLDVANPGEMNLLNDVDLDPEEYGPYRNISFSDDIVYARGHSGITLLDVSDPTAVLEIGLIPKDDAMCTLTARDGYVFVYSTSSFCDRDSETRRLTIYDASSPTAIQTVGSLNLDSHVETMMLKDDNLYLVGDDLTVIDISQPEFSQSIGRFPTPGNAQDAVIVNDLVYVADDAGGLLVLKFVKQS